MCINHIYNKFIKCTKLYIKLFFFLSIPSSLGQSALGHLPEFRQKAKEAPWMGGHCVDAAGASKKRKKKMQGRQAK